MNVKEIEMALVFLQRVTLQGSEVAAFQQVVNALVDEARSKKPESEIEQESEGIDESIDEGSEGFEEVDVKPKKK